MATLAQRIQDLATRIGTEAKALRTLICGNTADLSALQTTAKNTLVAAINELKGLVDAAGSTEVDDSVTNLVKTWSSQKISDQITAAINSLAAGAPAALNSIDELAAALQDDANVVAGILTALGNRLRVDAAQSFTAPEKAQARTNIGADITTAEIGNPDTDFVAVFNTALA